MLTWADNARRCGNWLASYGSKFALRGGFAEVSLRRLFRREQNHWGVWRGQGGLICPLNRITFTDRILIVASASHVGPVMVRQIN